MVTCPLESHVMLITNSPSSDSQDSTPCHGVPSSSTFENNLATPNSSVYVETFLEALIASPTTSNWKNSPSLSEKTNCSFDDDDFIENVSIVFMLNARALRRAERASDARRACTGAYCYWSDGLLLNKDTFLRTANYGTG